MGLLAQVRPCGLRRRRGAADWGVSRQFARGPVAGYRVGLYSGLTNTGVWFYRIGTTLFDCGSPNQAKHVVRAAQRAGATKVLVSHHHEDHGA